MDGISPPAPTSRLLRVRRVGEPHRAQSQLLIEAYQRLLPVIFLPIAQNAGPDPPGRPAVVPTRPHRPAAGA